LTRTRRQPHTWSDLTTTTTTRRIKLRLAVESVHGIRVALDGCHEARLLTIGKKVEVAVHDVHTEVTLAAKAYAHVLHHLFVEITLIFLTSLARVAIASHTDERILHGARAAHVKHILCTAHAGRRKHTLWRKQALRRHHVLRRKHTARRQDFVVYGVIVVVLESVSIAGKASPTLPIGAEVIGAEVIVPAPLTVKKRVEPVALAEGWVSRIETAAGGQEKSVADLVVATHSGGW
jgi:hypothetical protein